MAQQQDQDQSQQQQSVDALQVTLTSANGGNDEAASGKSFHIFISYRVRTDSDLAEKLCDKFQGLPILNEQREVRFKCFLDKQNLTQGTSYKQEFMAGLNGSCLFLPLVSEDCLKSMLDLKDGGEDNVLKEWETAISLHSQGKLELIPVLVGRVEHKDGGLYYKRFDAFWILSSLPEVVMHDSITGKTCREIVAELFKIQGIFINPTELKDKLTSIQMSVTSKNKTVFRFSSDIWPKYRTKWVDQTILGAEPTLTCIQCLLSYQNSTNHEGVCRFHLTDGPNPQYEGTKYACCGSTDPSLGCKRAKHHDRHHNDYLYGSFLVWMRGILNYTNMSERMGSVSVEDARVFNSSTAYASVGRVLRGAGVDADK
ncbi:hypothetical protein HDU76_010143, partial [Blyttiomyces sp. JEL0837]